MNQLFIILTVLTLGSWLFARRRWYAPSVLMTGVWWIALGAYVLIDHELHPLKPTTIEAFSV